MKKLIALLLVLSLILSGCAAGGTNSSNPSDAATSAGMESAVSAETEAAAPASTEAAVPDSEEEMPFSSMNDPSVLKNIEESVYSELNKRFENGEYTVENVEAIYVSKEYLEDISYNSKENIFFGYTLSELREQFQGTRYVFSLGEDGKTEVVPFADDDDTFDQVLKDVAIGAGVIIVCVTISAMTGGAGAPVTVILASSAKKFISEAFIGVLFAGVSAGIAEGIKTQDFESALKAGAKSAGEKFKWGAISGLKKQLGGS